MSKTKQQTFNKAVNGLLDQGKRASVNDNTFASCKYRWRGLKCAVGHLIPDKSYKKSLEGEAISDYSDESPINKLMIKLGHDVRLCSKLQDAHDGANDFNSMCNNLIELAEDESLTLPKRLRL